MRIRITAGFCAWICLLGWINLRLCGWFLLAVSVHELGHLIALRKCRVPIKSVCLNICGAVIETEQMRYGKDWLCAAAGPLFGVILGVCLLRYVTEGAMISLILSAVNVLPLYPLDGGRMICAFAYSCFPECTAKWIVQAASMGTCVILMLGACWITIVLQAGVWPMFAVLLLLCRAGDSEKLLLFSGAEDKMKRQVK